MPNVRRASHLALALCTWTSLAAAQAESAPKAEAPPAATVKAEAPPAATVKAEAPPAATVKAEAPPSLAAATREPGVSPWEARTLDEALSPVWHGGLETDVGYAKYTHSVPTTAAEDFYDFRGRFVVGPEITHPFGGEYFLRAKAQLVAWIREAAGIYQINADDVYGQIGQKGVWDVTLGRFMTWRVYQKGLGFDLYTLEDTGALLKTFVSSAFYPHIYEVDEIFYRAQSGRVAAHVYPTPWSGIEVTGQYGSEITSNILGGRVAAGVSLPFLTLIAGAEYRSQRPSQEQYSLDANNAKTFCDDCGKTKTYGGGGSAAVKVKPIEVGVSAATERSKTWSSLGAGGGTLDTTSSFKRTSFGGYGELDVGTLVLGRSLKLGAGLDRTETLFDSSAAGVAGTFLRHVQGAAYVAYPLGFNDSMVKLVVSKADGTQKVPQGPGLPDIAQDDHMLAARLRLTMNF
jgi:hypothetical protein